MVTQAPPYVKPARTARQDKPCDGNPLLVSPSKTPAPTTLGLLHLLCARPRKCRDEEDTPRP